MSKPKCPKCGGTDLQIIENPVHGLFVRCATLGCYTFPVNTFTTDLPTMPLGEIQRKCLQQRPTLDDLQAESRSPQVYRTSPTADFKPKESPKDALTRLVVDECNKLGISKVYMDRAANVFLAQKDMTSAIRYIRATAQLSTKEAKEYVDILRGL